MKDNFDLSSDAVKNALAVVKEDFNLGKHLRATTSRSWWHYNGKYWELLIEPQIKKVLFEVFKENYPNYKELATRAAKLGIEYLELELMGPDFQEFSGEGTSIINCSNCELWLNKDGTYAQKKHSEMSNLRYVLSVDYIPSAKAPAFAHTLKEIFSECDQPEEVIRHLEEVLAYIISSRRNIPIIIMFIGKGSNGKTRLSQTLMQLLDENSVLSTNLQTLVGDSFFEANLPGKCLLLDDDLDADSLLPDGKLKKISEAKKITARHPHGTSFSFVSKAVPLLIANHLPKTKDLSEGLRRRMHIFRFDRVFKGADKNEELFPEIWKEELPGILNILLEAYKRLVERGDFLLPKEMVENVDAWLAEANVVPAFLENACETAPDLTIKGTDLYYNFKIWAKECGYRSLPNRHELYAQIEKLGFKKTKPQNAVTFHGLGVTLGQDGA